MLGTFQQSNLRIEVEATASAIASLLCRPDRSQEWLGLQQFESGSPEELYPNLTFTTSVGFLVIKHQVEIVHPNYLRLLLSQGIDGFHEWYWGEGWVQSRLEGVSLLPLNLIQTLSLLRLQSYLAATKTTANSL